MQVVFLNTQDDLSLLAWYKHAKNQQPTILYLHGNAGHIGYRMPLARQLINAGFGVFLLEYRGYGGNKGSPNESGLYKDADAALKYLRAHGIESNKLVVFGESLGSGIATQVAEKNPVCGLILQTPFTSLTDVARFHYPWLLIKPWDRYNSLGRMHSIHAPLLILHGTEDSIVPYHQGVTLYHQASQPKQLVTFENKDHNDLWNEVFVKEVIQFLDKLKC